MANQTYTSTVYSREITYTNLNGEVRTLTLQFLLDPLLLMELITSVKFKTHSNSGNPAKRGQDREISDDEQIRFIRSLAVRAAGAPSKDGETWEAFEEFDTTIAGKAFLTKLTSSDGDRKEFAEKVVVAPFRAFVEFAVADETNTASDVQDFKVMLGQLENIFKTEPEKPETFAEKRARLEAELAATPLDGE